VGWTLNRLLLPYCQVTVLDTGLSIGYYYPIASLCCIGLSIGSYYPIASLVRTVFLCCVVNHHHDSKSPSSHDLLATPTYRVMWSHSQLSSYFREACMLHPSTTATVLELMYMIHQQSIGGLKCMYSTSLAALNTGLPIAGFRYCITVLHRITWRCAGFLCYTDFYFREAR
jgi:hypothetical protein